MSRRRWLCLLAAAAVYLTAGCGTGPTQVAGENVGFPEIADLGAQLADLIIQSRGTVDRTPGDLGYAYTDFEVASANGSLLRGWFIPAEAGKGTVVFHQGNNGNRSSYLEAIDVFVPNGYSLILYDYQGFGDSQGEADFDTLLEDAMAVHEWAAENVGGQFVSMGASLGGPPAMHAALNAPGVRGLILDSPLVVDELALLYLSTLAGVDFDEAMEPLAQSVILAQFPPAFDMVSQAPLLLLPAMVIQGTSDTVTPATGAQRVYDALGGAKDLWLTPSEHGGSIRDFPDEYESRVVAFLDSVFGA